MRARHAFVLVCSFLTLTRCGGPEDQQSDPLDETSDEICSAVDANRELMIKHLAVVNDPVRTRWTGAVTNPNDGAWHFGRLMRNMAGTQDPAVFVRQWLGTWEANRTVNGQTVPARTAIRDLINRWPKAPDGKLDLTRAPLRLLAIVNRLDLRNLAAGKAGEGRFVFGVLDAAGNPLSFTVILEYNLPGSTAADVTRWANDWHNLGTLTASSEAYKAALQRLTDRFAGANAAPTRPNGSSLSQLRTNEIALAAPWELREFRIATSGRLAEVAVAQTPANAINGTAKLARFINQNQAAILAGRHVVPASFEMEPFRAGAIFNNIDFWSATGVSSNQARHLLSVATCNGCHGAETSTFFLHVNPRPAGQAAVLSGFLTGESVNDPVSGAARTFNDLGRRRTDLRSLVCAPAAQAEAAAMVAAPEALVH